MRSGFLLLALVALAAAAPASAKEITAAALCGPAGCTDVGVPQGLHDFPGGGQSQAAPPAAGGFLQVRLTYDGRHLERMWYVPAARTFAIPDGYGSVRWLPAGTHELDQLLVAAAADVEPFRPVAVAALVGEERVAGDASGYLDLFGVESTGPARAGGERYVPVSVKTQPASPWALTNVWFYPETGLLERGLELITLPAGVADDLAAARPIDAASGGGAGFDWPLVSGWLLAGVALVLTAVLLSRRGRRPRPA
jgi:hypothetical protein